MTSNQSSPSSSPTMVALTTGMAAAAAGALYIYRNLPTKPKEAPARPPLVLDALEANEPIYYLGIGSNLSRKKLENRSMSGQKIQFMSMEPCVVHHHQLAFNMRGFPPLEPAMGSVEPLPSFYELQNENNYKENDATLATHATHATHATQQRIEKPPESKPLKAYERQECHGALIQLSAHDYELVYKSEGGGTGARQGYEEIIVECEPYDKSKPPVKAVAFRTREHVRLKQDPCPSKRYMNIIREGAAELGLKECYQQWLKDHPVQEPSKILKKIAVNSAIFTATLAFRLKFTILSEVQNIFLRDVYVPSTEPKWKQVMGEVAAGTILFPTFCIGFPLRWFLQISGLMPPMLKQWILSLE